MSRECFHGGAFWNDIGPEFDDLQRRRSIVAADVLDAWFPPSPQVLSGLAEAGEWVYGTSPPTHSEGLVEVISKTRGLPAASVLPGPGSSALLYLALGEWLRPGSKVVLIEPSYGEYAHFCTHVVPCDIRFVMTHHRDQFALDLDEWVSAAQGAELAVLVRPNNPTGAGIDLAKLRSALLQLDPATRVLVDEAYIDYTSMSSAERLLPEFPHLSVVKSLSKCFGLSGLRVAYLAGSETASLRRRVPPWWVSLPAQIAAVRAFDSPEYYAQRYEETCSLRHHQASKLASLNLRCFGAANWLLLELPSGSDAAGVVATARERGVFIRDAGKSARSLADRWVRCAVRGSSENQRIVDVLRALLA
jgi:histidinol-phosphate/aromatic aminotransferase/cobyric acid decarboxylase-like protein